MPFAATWVDLDIIMLSEVSQTEKDKYNIAYMWNLKKKDPRPIDIDNQLVVTNGEWGRDKLEVWD